MAQYVVKPGDTLSGIGQRLGVDWHQITGFRSGNPNLIYPGETLTVPSGGGSGKPTTSFGDLNAKYSSLSSSQPQPQTQTNQTTAPTQPVVNTPQIATPSLTPAQMAEDLVKRSANEIQSRFKQYEGAKGPFVFDQVLMAKRNEAKEQIDPYYNETLSDYLLGVNRKIQRSNSDTQDLLSELQAKTNAFSESTQLNLKEAINNAKEGYANAGLFDSGARYRSEGLATTEAGNNLANYTRAATLQSKQIQQGNARTLEDIGLSSKQNQRNIAREQFTSEETRAAELAKQAGQKYVQGFQATLSPEQQANTNFDLLKQIGIYS